MAVDLDRLLKLRLVVARYGEMDRAAGGTRTGCSGATERSPSSAGSRAPTDSPRRASSSLSPALAARSSSTPPLGHAWRLPAEVEDQFDDRWQAWLGEPDSWNPFFDELATAEPADLPLRARGTRPDLAGTYRGRRGTPPICRRPRGSAHRRTRAQRRPHHASRGRLRQGRARAPAIPYAKLAAALRPCRSRASNVVSSFTIIKGSLIDETYEAFAAWDFSETKLENLQRLERENAFGALSHNWSRDVRKVLNRRYDPDGSRPPDLSSSHSAGCDRAVWRPLLLWHMTRDEFLVRDFLVNWLYPAVRGRRVRARYRRRRGVPRDTRRQGTTLNGRESGATDDETVSPQASSASLPISGSSPKVRSRSSPPTTSRRQLPLPPPCALRSREQRSSHHRRGRLAHVPHGR